MRAGNTNAARWAPAWDARQKHLTPAYILDPVREAMGGRFGLDPASMEENPTEAEVWCYVPGRDGLSLRWTDYDAIWCNPPYGDAMRPFVSRSIETGQAGRKVALLIPAHTDTNLSQTAMREAESVCFIAGKVWFGTWTKGGTPARATHPSMLLAWGWTVPDGLGVVL